MEAVRTHMVIEMDVQRRNDQLDTFVETLVESAGVIERIDTEDGEVPRFGTLGAGQADEDWVLAGNLGHQVRLIIEY